MSVDFTATEAVAQYTKVPCDSAGCLPGARCGYCQDGIMEERTSNAPSLNLANGNARVIIDVLLLPVGDPSDLWGEIRVSELAEYRRRILYFRNRQQRLSTYERQTETEPNYVSMGLTSQGIMERLERLDGVLAWAQENGSVVQWG